MSEPVPAFLVVEASELKMLRETLAEAQASVRTDDQSPQTYRDRLVHVDRLQALIDQIDLHRPLGPDGKHGDRHTPTCGCEDAPAPEPAERHHVLHLTDDQAEVFAESVDAWFALNPTDPDAAVVEPIMSALRPVLGIEAPPHAVETPAGFITAAEVQEATARAERAELTAPLGWTAPPEQAYDFTLGEEGHRA